MLESLYAVRYVCELDGGRNRPWLLEAEREDGTVVEVVVKLGTAECGYGGLVREAYCSMLAADLGLPVAEPFVVELASDFVQTLPASLRHRASPQALAFGVTFVQGMFPITATGPLTGQMRTQAEEAITFDAGVVNSDRLVQKPNCLSNGRTLLLIDHEMALNLHGRGLLMVDPWLPSALLHMAQPPFQHVFYSVLKVSRADQPAIKLGGFVGRLGAITQSRVTEYRDAIPSEWDRDGVSADIADFLTELLQRAADLGREVEGLLS